MHYSLPPERSLSRVRHELTTDRARLIHSVPQYLAFLSFDFSFEALMFSHSPVFSDTGCVHFLLLVASWFQDCSRMRLLKIVSLVQSIY
jgi:hypothetical protein